MIPYLLNWTFAGRIDFGKRIIAFIIFYVTYYFLYSVLNLIYLLVTWTSGYTWSEETSGFDVLRYYI